MAVYEEYLNYRLTGRCSNPFWQRKFGGVSGGGGDAGGDGGEPAELLSWEGVAYHIDKGDYKDVYAVGDMIPLDLGSEGIINMQIAAFDADTLADGSGTAAISWVAMELLATKHRMNAGLVINDDGTYQEETGTIGGWEKCEMRAYLQNTIKPLLSPTVANIIVPVTKTQSSTGTTGTDLTQTTEDEVFLPDYSEVSRGGLYTTLLGTSTSRIKYIVNGAKNMWWLRGTTGNRYYAVATTGSMNTNQPTTMNHGVCLGFCTGKTPT